jgi:hypothetical protein
MVKEFAGLPRTHFGFHWDHIEPRCNGGTDDWLNLAPSCRSCNTSKRSAGLPAWLARRVDPVKKATRLYDKARRDARAVVCDTAAEQDLEALLRASLRVA